MKSLIKLIFLLVAVVVSQERPISTYSIVAYDESTGELGVAVQSHWFSVGSIVPWAKAGIGAVATQSFARVEYGPDGLRLMEEGLTAGQALEKLVATDQGRAVRQVGMVDSKGNTAVHTGEKCIEFAGHKTGKNYTVQANLMEGPTVWHMMSLAFETAEGDLADRMMSALEAAEEEGGDLRGRQSASMLIVAGEPTGVPWKDVVLDLRVEDHPEPLRQLKRLIRIHKAYKHANKGDHYMETGEIEKALVEYNHSSGYYPENPELRYWTAVALVGKGRLDEALPIFRDVFREAPQLRALTPRIVPSGLIPDDPSKLDKILKLD